MNSGRISKSQSETPISFTHILNTVSQNENSDLYQTQLHTIDSMHQAQKYSSESVSINFVQISTSSLPEPLLNKASCMLSPFCITKIKGLENEKKLPLLLRALKYSLKNDPSDYFIYTNSDILLAPQFYNFAAEKIRQGHDALIINRRRVSGKYQKEYQYDLLVSETGLLHPGYDAFVVKKELLDKFEFTDICVGVEGACNDFFLNVFVFATNPILLTKQNLTFHIGYELVKPWGTKNITKHNLKELSRLTKKLSPLLDITKFPGSNLPFLQRHFKWLMNPTVSYPMLLKADLKQFFRKRNFSNEKKDSGNFYYEWLLEKISF